MNFEKLKIASILLITLLLSSCNTIKLNNLTNEQDLSKKIEVVDIISEKDKLSHNGKKIGDIVFISICQTKLLVIIRTCS